ncbi:MAG: LamG-like jellyroll fold domain-containing protein [Flavisolibacter sp.]
MNRNTPFLLTFILFFAFCSVSAQNCNNWLNLPSQPSFVSVGDLDVTGDQITVEASFNRTSPWSGSDLYQGDLVSKHEGPNDCNYLLRPGSAEITTTYGYFKTPTICPIELNKTYHVAMVYDGATLKFYRNGFLMSQIPAYGDLFQNDWMTQIGLYFHQASPENFIGYVNEVRIWKIARTQSEIKAYMNSSLPSPSTQTGLLAYYTFDNLANKQGNPAWNGSLGGSAVLNKPNPTCAAYVPDSCCIPASGTLKGSNICSGGMGTLTFTALTGAGPFNLTYSDGTSTFTQTNVQSGTPFSVSPQPAVNTTYKLLTIQGSGNCPATPVSSVSANISVSSCIQCTGSLGDPVVNITFGSGNGVAPSLPIVAPGASTSYSFISTSGTPAAPTPLDGEYTITNNVPSNPSWYAGYPDHTPGDTNGYMAFFNSSQNPGEFYNQKVTGLCENTKYNFAAWIANVVDPTKLTGVQPNLSFVIEKVDGTLISSFDTGPINETNSFVWKEYGFYFKTPPGTGSVVLKIKNLNGGGLSVPGNDLAIDDITFRPCGPSIASSFSSLSAQAIKTQCGYGSISLFGNVSSSDYVNPALLWQVSSDGGASWTDLPLSNTPNYTYTPSNSGSFLFRMLTAEASNIQLSTCRVVSNIISLKVFDLPQATYAGDTICKGSSGQLTFSATKGTSPFAITYNNGTIDQTENVTGNNAVFNYSPLTTTQYNIIYIEDANGCKRTTDFTNPSATITVNDKPVAVAPAVSTICQGDTVLLTAEGGNQYSWAPIQGLSDAHATSPKAFPNITTDYTLIVTNLENCKDTTHSLVKVNSLPNIYIGKDTTICLGDQLTLDAAIPEATSYLWNTGDTTAKIMVRQAGLYSVKARISGCIITAKDTILLSSLDVPSVSLGPDTSICSFATLQVKAQGDYIKNYEWNTGSRDSFLIIKEPGIYSILVTNQCGSASDEVNITVKPCSDDLFFPSAFTPNSDALNDRFKAAYFPGISIYDYHMRLYNRWGQMVYQTRDYTNGWDGKISGILQGTGVYIWQAEYRKTAGGPLISKKGTVTLVR